LLLDEPTASVALNHTGDWVRSYIEEYRRKSDATILLASHNMAEVERLCSDVMMMKKGRIVDRGSPTALIRRALWPRHAGAGVSPRHGRAQLAPEKRRSARRAQ